MTNSPDIALTRDIETEEDENGTIFHARLRLSNEISDGVGENLCVVIRDPNEDHRFHAAHFLIEELESLVHRIERAKSLALTHVSECHNNPCKTCILARGILAVSR
jgi:hypothetical protein